MTTYLDGRVTLFGGDCLDVIKGINDASIDSVVTDPPYALVSISKRFGKDGAAAAKVGKTGAYARASAGFMGKQWDNGDVAFAVEFWAEVLRVLKPGGHVLAFGGTRTYHRLACAIEDAGFEIRDQIGWAYGSGFPKSHDVSKGIAKRRSEDIDPVRVVCRFIRAGMDAQGKKSRDLVGHFGDCNPRLIDHWAARDTDSQPSLPTPAQWELLVDVLDLSGDDDFGFIAAEVARLNERKGTRGERWTGAEVIGEVAATPAGFGDLRFEGDRSIRALDDEAERFRGWGTALKPAWEPIVMARKPLVGTVAQNVLVHGTGAINIDDCRIHTNDAKGYAYTVQRTAPGATQNATGERKQVGVEYQGQTQDGRWPANIIHDGSDEVIAAFPEAPGQQRAVTGEERSHRTLNAYGDFGASPTGAEPRNDEGSAARFFYSSKADADDRIGSKHPTVKPVDLMQYLVRLVTPKGGVVLDPFAGTGTTGEAAFREGMRAILIERETEYLADIERRMELAQSPTKRAAVAAGKGKLQGAEGTPLFDF